MLLCWLVVTSSQPFPPPDCNGSSRWCRQLGSSVQQTVSVFVVQAVLVERRARQRIGLRSSHIASVCGGFYFWSQGFCSHVESGSQNPLPRPPARGILEIFKWLIILHMFISRSINPSPCVIGLRWETTGRWERAVSWSRGGICLRSHAGLVNWQS